MKDNKITVVFDKDDSKKFNEISKKTRWNDKFLISIALKSYYEKFKEDWKKEIIKALEDSNK